jgi:hypothetical protein
MRFNSFKKNPTTIRQKLNASFGVNFVKWEHLLYFMFISFLFLNTNVQANQNQLYANAAKLDLTPPLEMKFALGGYGARMSQPAQGIHDRIWAKAIILSDGNKKYAIVTLDVLALPPNVKPQVLAHLRDAGWKDENVMLLPSHTHSSLDMSALNDRNTLDNPFIGIYQPRLKNFVVESIAKVITKADTNLIPVNIGTACTTVMGMNRNRRNDAAVDRDLTLTRVDTEKGKPLAVLLNWTAHTTIMDDTDMWVSGGWPGYLQRELESWIGEGVICMYYNGAQGDQSPIRPAGASHYEQAEIYGREIAKKAFDLYSKIEPKSLSIFTSNHYQLDLPSRIAHPAFKATGGKEYGIDDKGMEIILNVMCPEKTTLTALRIDDWIIAGVPGELSCELGLHVKSKLRNAGIKYPVIGGIADEWISYIVTAEQYEEGGYETSVSFYGPHLGDTILKGILNAAMPLVR